MTTHRSSRPKAEYNQEALYHAVVNKEKQTILMILQHDIDWTLPDYNGDTVLHLAFDRQDNTQQQIIEILKIFLDLGLDANVKNSIGRTVMHLAVREKFKEVVEFLLNRGGDLNIYDERGNSIAHYLVETEFKLFREYVFAYGSSEDRNLFERESVEFFYWLMTKGLDVECPNKVGLTACQLALQYNLQHILPIFLKYAKDVNFVDEKDGTTLHIFLKKNHCYKDYRKRYETKKVAIPSFFYEPKYCTNIVQILLDKDISVDTLDWDRNTPLHLAGKMRESDILIMMLEKFTKVNVRNKYGETVLHIVSSKCRDYAGIPFDGYVDVVRTLISKGADINLVIDGDFTSVQLAAIQKHLGIIKVLKEHNAYFHELTLGRENLLHLISVNMNEMVCDKTYDEMVDLLVSEGCDVNAKDNDDVTPLHLAAKFGSLAVVKKLIEYGAQVNCREQSRLATPLHLAVEFEHTKVIKELIQAGANVNDKDILGVTPLHRAVRHFTGNTVKLLLKFGAHVDTQDECGRSALDKAIKYDNPSGVEELLKYGADINDPKTLKEVELLNNNYMYHVLLDHWHKLQALGLPCADDYMYYNEKDFKSSRDSYFEEVQELKTCMIDKRTSLFNFLRMNRNKKCFYVKNNAEIEELVNSPTLELQFPKFHGLILASYRDGLARNQLLEPAKRAWYELTKINLPNICLEAIFDNLNNANLRKMIEGDDIKRLKKTFSRKTDKSAKKIRFK